MLYSSLINQFPDVVKDPRRKNNVVNTVAGREATTGKTVPLHYIRYRLVIYALEYFFPLENPSFTGRSSYIRKAKKRTLSVKHISTIHNNKWMVRMCVVSQTLTYRPASTICSFMSGRKFLSDRFIYRPICLLVSPLNSLFDKQALAVAPPGGSICRVHSAHGDACSVTVALQALTALRVCANNKQACLYTTEHLRESRK